MPAAAWQGDPILGDSMMKKWSLLITVGLCLFLLVACSGQATNGIQVENAWGRVSPMMAENGAFYMNLKNSSSADDALLRVEVEACGTVELHETYMLDGGMMGMRPVEGGKVVVPAGQTVELKVGGLHVMCLGIDPGFVVGQKIPVTLVFEKGGEMVVDVEIRTEAP